VNECNHNCIRHDKSDNGPRNNTDDKIRVNYSEGPLFQKSTIPTKPKPNPKAEPNPNPDPHLKSNFNPNVSTVARICTMDFRSSGPSE